MQWLSIDSSTLLIFAFVYFGMVIGNIPGLSLNRASIALFGAICMIEVQNIPLAEISLMFDLSTLAMLFGLMILSSQFYYGGFYGYFVARISKFSLSPSLFLLAIILFSGLFSAVLINDVVCLAMTPILIKACRLKKLNSVPFLIGLACASNIGSGLTLIGNPQNILIGQTIDLSFGEYLLNSCVPVFLGCLVTWRIIAWKMKNRWHQTHPIKDKLGEYPELDRWQTAKGFLVLAGILVLFLFYPSSRDHIVLGAAAVLLLSKRLSSHNIFSFINWQLLILFIGLFIVNYQMIQSGMLNDAVSYLTEKGVNIKQPHILFITSAILSNIISNVPAVMLLLPFTQNDPFYGSLLALSSTLAGNLFILGSIANIIVFTESAEHGISIKWKDHVKYGVPITLLTLFIAAIWIYARLHFF